MEDWGNANRNMLYSQLENVGVNSDSVWVYIENIPEAMTESELRQELENCAEVVYPRDSDGKAQGFCYAHMSDISTRADFTAKSKDEEKVTLRGQPLHVYRLIQGHDRFKRGGYQGGGFGPMKRPRQDTGFTGYRPKPYDNRPPMRQRYPSPPMRGRFRGGASGGSYRGGMSGYAGAGYREENAGGVHKLLSGLEKILERHERDDRPRGPPSRPRFQRESPTREDYDDRGYQRRTFPTNDRYPPAKRFAGRGDYGGPASRPQRFDSGRYGSSSGREDFRRGPSPSRGYGGYSGGGAARYSPHRSQSHYGTVSSGRVPYGSGGSSWSSGGYMGN